MVRGAGGRQGNAEPQAMDLDWFVSDQNIARYRRLASAGTTEVERIELLEMLAEEEAKFIEMQKTTGAAQ
jgi:hypothetical protein